MFYVVIFIQTAINTGIGIGAILLAGQCLEVKIKLQFFLLATKTCMYGPDCSIKCIFVCDTDNVLEPFPTRNLEALRVHCYGDSRDGCSVTAPKFSLS